MSDIIIPSCPVEVGDYFYRTNYCVQTGSVMPDRIQVLSVEKLAEPIVLNEETGSKAYYKIHGKYIYHAIGPDLEKDFVDSIFKDPKWVIEKKSPKRRMTL